MIMYVITILSLLFGLFSIYLMLKYLYLYRNLKTNFKSFLKFVDQHYLPKNDIILHNAAIEALEKARQNNSAFEIKAYTKLLQKLKEDN